MNSFFCQSCKNNFVSKSRKRIFCSRECSARFRFTGKKWPNRKSVRPKDPRVCQTCKIVFSPTGSKQRICSSCSRTIKARNIALRYGITLEQKKEMYEKQSGLCILCRERDAKCIDHDHLTGRVRGLLCVSCNTALNRIESVQGWAERAHEYLGRNK